MTRHPCFCLCFGFVVVVVLLICVVSCSRCIFVWLGLTHGAKHSLLASALGAHLE